MCKALSSIKVLQATKQKKQTNNKTKKHETNHAGRLLNEQINLKKQLFLCKVMGVRK
jgi:hypothetical protein